MIVSLSVMADDFRLAKTVSLWVFSGRARVSARAFRGANRLVSTEIRWSFVNSSFIVR